MCTVVVLVRPDLILLAANRDERLERPCDPPAAWWDDRPGVIGGRDRLGGGTWMAMNRHGVVATVLNRPGTLGPAIGKRSRGELPLMALEHATAAAAAHSLAR
ncbi:MAG TPA: NRDE family protein, partial [Rhodopila sp.]